MNKRASGLAFLFIFLCSCANPQKKRQEPSVDFANKTQDKSVTNSTATTENFSRFLPEGYILFDTVYGDFNKDGSKDCILIVKGTDKTNVVKNDNGEMVDRNRRGLIILSNNNNQYEIVLSNLTCFSSENEEGGVYYPPDLSLSIEKGNLVVNYSHGRYGYWSYIFRWNQKDFDLIGYDASENRGPVVNSTRSINCLSGKKQTKTNTNDTAEGDDEVFVEKWEKIKPAPLIRLSEVTDFDEVNFD